MTARADPVPALFRDKAIAARLGLVVDSYERLTGRTLIAPTDDIAAALWEAPVAILAHDTQPDPVFFFGNRAALEAFDCSPEEFARMPSRLSAEAPLREERQAFLDRVAREGFIDDYAGIRISAKGRRFRIEGATVWNLVDANGARHGQAATFAV